MGRLIGILLAVLLAVLLLATPDALAATHDDRTMWAGDSTSDR